MSNTIDYGTLMHNAMRSLIRRVLTDVAQNGLPGAHHFFITFDTRHPEAKLADWLHERYPEEMTIVIQHWFDALVVTDEGFSVTLNFGDAPEALQIPYDAIKTFVDPSVEFGLRFEASEDDDFEDEDEEDETLFSDHDEAPEAPMVEQAEPEKRQADVVSLDQFRK
jgi:hypothetical protein